MTDEYGYVEGIVRGMICMERGHDWTAHGPMYSDGWERKCQRCGKVESVNR